MESNGGDLIKIVPKSAWNNEKTEANGKERSNFYDDWF